MANTRDHDTRFPHTFSLSRSPVPNIRTRTDIFLKIVPLYKDTPLGAQTKLMFSIFYFIFVFFSDTPSCECSFVACQSKIFESISEVNLFSISPHAHLEKLENVNFSPIDTQREKTSKPVYRLCIFETLSVVFILKSLQLLVI